MQDPFHVVEYHCVSSVLEHVKRETACCDHLLNKLQSMSEVGCRSREDSFLERESSQRLFLIQTRCQNPAQEPELPFRVQIL